ncbi:unnamed protein product [Rotaria sp. Silwood1]|nr:unnamed protein product [Rotaria sp. Silwood1]CAF4878476.1 unnamed protein product [Rotaria sp. Silwood1]
MANSSGSLPPYSIVPKKLGNDSSATTSPILPNAARTPIKVKLKIDSSSKNNSSAYRQVLETCLELTKKRGIHSVNAMKAAGFRYTGIGDAACCDKCQLEVTNWKENMDPFTIHSQRSQNCSFVCSMKSSIVANASLSTSISCTTPGRATMESTEREQPSKRQKTDVWNDTSYSYQFIEVKILKEVRFRTFSHWPHSASPSRTQMIESGFFSCNVGDRVICLYCNLIIQQWTPHTDDPCEVHKILSPQCPFVLGMLIRPMTASILIVNESSASNQSVTGMTINAFRSNGIVLTAACNVAYIEIPKRHASFATWPNEALPSVDDLVRAGFFYTGTRTVVTCFYCNGSLQNWGANDNPMIEHARWFPHCLYAKQLCGDDMYRKIQESKRIAQERVRAADPARNVSSSSQKLLIPDENTLSRLVAARLDLPISQSLLDRDFKLSIIKRCWEDQLRLKRMD